MIGVEAEPGESLAAALIRLGNELETPCGGRGRCSGCRVRVAPPEAVEPTPGPAISGEDARRGWRLACRAFPREPVLVELPAPVVPPVRELGSPGRGGRPLGLAIDLGTTTVAGAVVDLRAGRELARWSLENPQVQLGVDVISRVARCSTPAGLEGLRRAAGRGLEELASELVYAVGGGLDDIDRAVVAGNAVMLHLALGLDPTPLGRSPWRLAESGGRELPAMELVPALGPRPCAWLPPIPDPFFGADGVAGLAALDRFQGRGTRLLVDLGTNGELALVHGGRAWCCSAPAGPAFEGVGLTCGAPAGPGSALSVEEVDGELEFVTAEGGEPVGLCGSGLADLLALLLGSGRVDPSGRMARSPLPLVGELRIEQNDVRQLQLAIAALRVGIDVLLEEAGLEPEELEEVVLAGAFGGGVRPSSLEAIGVLPPGLAARVTAAGNTSLAGATRLLDPARRAAAEALAGRLEPVRLAGRTDFHDRFLARLRFPG